MNIEREPRRGAVRTCKRCGVDKPLDAFHAVANCRGGRRPVCRECVARETRARAESDPDATRAADRQRRRRYREKHGSEPTDRERIRDWERRNPEKKRAHWAVKDALKKGALVKGPCAVCEAERVHAHHDDYAKPLDVRWLCPAHHGEVHRLREAA